MARTKSAGGTKVKLPTRLQDQSGLIEFILDAVAVEITNAIDGRLTDVEARVDTLEVGALRFGTVELRHGGFGGTTILHVDDEFTDEQIGRPVLMMQAPANESPIVLFAGTVLHSRALAVRWASMQPAPARTGIVYLIR